MRPYKRTDRVGALIQQMLSEILTKDIKDPRLQMATITGVKMTPDLKIAYIYFTISGVSENKQRNEEASEGFKSALGYIKRTLATQLGLRYMPELKFFYDESFEYGARIDLLLRNLEKKNE